MITKFHIYERIYSLSEVAERTTGKSVTVVIYSRVRELVAMTVKFHLGIATVRGSRFYCFIRIVFSNFLTDELKNIQLFLSGALRRIEYSRVRRQSGLDYRHTPRRHASMVVEKKMGGRGRTTETRWKSQFTNCD